MAWIHFFHHDDSPPTCEFPITPVKPFFFCLAPSTASAPSRSSISRRLVIGEISAKIARVSTVQEISRAIEHLNVRDQMRLLHDLPAHLKIQPDDVGWLKAAEPAFEFWNNPEDAIYDEL
jgi:hypothetical protein